MSEPEADVQTPFGFDYQMAHSVLELLAGAATALVLGLLIGFLAGRTTR